MLVLNYPPLSLIAEKIIYYLITYIFYHFTLSKTHCFASCLHIKWTDHYNVLDESKLLCRHNLEDNSWFLRLSLELLFFRNLSHYTTSCQPLLAKKLCRLYSLVLRIQNDAMIWFFLGGLFCWNHTYLTATVADIAYR